MWRLYHILRKKSTFILVVLVLSFVLAGSALTKTPNDPKYLDQEKMWDRIGAKIAWDVGTGSKRIVVTTIDTGADIWHEDLRDNIWHNPGEIPDNAIDDDNNGYVDDVSGWNFIEKNNDVRTSVFDAGSDVGAVDHGTVVAGLIGATGDNNFLGAGINWQVQIMPLRAVNSNGSGSLYDVTDAIYYAINNGANVISLSLVTSEYDEDLRAALFMAYQRGIVVVAAAGNDSYDLNQAPIYPACYDVTSTENWIIGVGALNSKDQLSSFTNYGDQCIDLLSPGTLIYSTERYAPGYGYLTSFGGPWQGTSFATPIVAGSVALIKSVRPDWNAKEITQSLFSGAEQFFNANFPNAVRYGRLNVGRSMSLTADGPNQDKAEQFIYASHKEEIRRYSLLNKKTEIFAKIKGGEIKNISTGDIDNDLKDEVIVLFKRDNFYYWRFYNSDANFLYERGLGTDLYRGGQIGKARFLEDSIDGGWYALDVYFPKTKKTKFFAFDKNGELVQSLILNGKFDTWSFTNHGVVVGKNIKKKTLITVYDWQGNKEEILERTGALSDIAMISLLDKDMSMALLITQKKNSGIVVWEPSSQSTREASLPTNGVYNLYGGHWLGIGTQSLLAFSAKNGHYQIFDTSLNPRQQYFIKK